MTYMRRHLSIAWSASMLSLVLAGGCGDSAHTLGSTGDGGKGGGSAGAGGTISRGGAGGGGTGGSVAGRGGTSGAAGVGGAGATAGVAGGGGGAGIGGAGATAGTGSGGRGGSGGSAGAGGRGGAGGSGGSAGAGGRGGTGGTGGVAGTGGTSTNACLTVPTLDRTCTTDADCFAASNIADCCGRLQYIGLHTTEQTRYAGLEQQCQATWPACTCATGPTTTDDGSRIKNGMSVGVTCRQGVCTTFVPACGGPCAAGLTCFSCQISGGQYGACTTPCTDPVSSTDCTNAALPRCEMGSSGNVDGTYCTAANVICDRRSVLSDCTGLVCGMNEQSVKVRNPALGTNQCACVAIGSGGRCADCTCGEPICQQYLGHCTGFALEGGLLCSLNG
jgi:hypothetical protein